jgi:hypothetical protein
MPGDTSPPPHTAYWVLVWRTKVGSGNRHLHSVNRPHEDVSKSTSETSSIFYVFSFACMEKFFLQFVYLPFLPTFSNTCTHFDQIQDPLREVVNNLNPEHEYWYPTIVIFLFIASELLRFILCCKEVRKTSKLLTFVLYFCIPRKLEWKKETPVHLYASLCYNFSIQKKASERKQKTRRFL